MAAILPNEQSSQSLSSFEFLPDSNDHTSDLGTGSFANVRLAQEKSTGKLFALKMIDLNPAVRNKTELYYLRTEIQNHRQLDHPNIIKFHDYIQEGSKLYLILDYAENGNLYNYIQSKKVLTPNEIFDFFYQTCLAVQYIHQNDIFHRDIKPENILVDKDLNVKLCDFGWSARYIYEKRTTFCGTYEYMAPEIVWKQPYDCSIDIWSLGVLLYELIHKEAPYKARSLSEIADSLTRPTLVFSATIQPEVKDLIEKILKIDPNERISMSEILSHTWVKYHLTKREYSNAAHNRSKQESSISPRFKGFYMNQALVTAKGSQEKNVYLHNISVDQPKQEQTMDNSPTVQVPKVVEVPRVALAENSHQPNSNASLDKAESPQNTMVMKENEQESMISAPVVETVRQPKGQVNCHSISLPKQQRKEGERRNASGDMGSRKLFEKDIMSPDFNSKLNSILGQLNVNTSQRRNGGLLGGILSPQSQNYNNIPKHQHSNSTYHFAENTRIVKQQVPKENVNNMTYDFSSLPPESNKLKNNQENFRPRAQVNPTNLRLDNMQGSQMTGYNARVKPETVKSSFQKYFAVEAGLSPKAELYQNNNNTTILNSTHDNSAYSFSKNVRYEGRANGYPIVNGGNNVQKKGALKSLENTISRGFGVGVQSTKNKENKVEISRNNWNYGLNESLFTQR